MAGLNRALALDIQATYNLHTFVETGTWKAQTTLWAAEHFGRVITVEGLKTRHDKTLASLKQQSIDLSRIEFLQGDSTGLMPSILNTVDEPALFWLDAHYCGTNEEEFAAGLSCCPLLAEIDAINAHPLAAQHCLIIDDVRLFGVEPGWPDLEIVKTRLATFSREITVFGDNLCAVPIGEIQRHGK
jgi:hypothetical protein